MSSDGGLKHNPFSSLRAAARPAPAPAAASRPVIAPPAAASWGRVVVREEQGAAAGAVITRVIGLSPEHRTRLGKRWQRELGREVLLEGRDLLLPTDDVERIAASLQDAGASEVKVVRREAPPDLGQVGEAGGTRRAEIRRGLAVAIVQKADQETGALTEGVVRDILTSSPEHPRGIKVRLESGEVGRVRRILARR